MTKITNITSISPNVSPGVKALRAIGHAGEPSPRSGARAQQLGRRRVAALGLIAATTATLVGGYFAIKHNSAGTSVYQRNLGACVVNAAGYDVKLGRHPETGALMAPSGLEDEFETCERDGLSTTEIESFDQSSGGRVITDGEIG